MKKSLDELEKTLDLKLKKQDTGWPGKSI